MTSTIGAPAPGNAPRHRISSDFAAGTAPTARPDTLRGKPSLSVIGFLVVEMAIGYEWFISGLDKFVRGDFPAGLADELLKKSAGTAEWYSGFLKSAVIPFARLFGYAIEASELLAGVALTVGPLIWLLAWDRVSDRTRRAVLCLTAAAAIGGAFLAINFHLANGASHPWLIPGEAFDEGIDLDSVLPAIQIVIATVSIILSGASAACERMARRPPDHSFRGGMIMMRHFHTAGRAALRPIASGLCTLGAAGLLGAARPAEAQSAEMPAAATEEAELPHPFFTHMGLPEGVGNFNLRTLGLVTRADGRTDGDFAFHLETGLTPTIGLHIRNDRFLNNDKTEAMFQFIGSASKDGMNGFAPIIEFEIPTHSGASRINTLVGFTTSLGTSRWAFNQVLHYDPREDMVDASAALVLRLGSRVFPVVEILGKGGSGAPTVVNLLAGLKVRLREWLHLGLAVQFPLTNAKDFSSQGVFGPDVEWKR